MRIRTQLVLAFLVLAVVPLTVIVVYSYYSSAAAMRAAMRADAAALTQQMDRRVVDMRQELGRRLSRISDAPIADYTTDGKLDPSVTRQLVLQFGDAAPMIERLELAPSPPEDVKSTAVPLPPMKPVVIDVEQIMRSAHEARDLARVQVPAVAPADTSDTPDTVAPDDETVDPDSLGSVESADTVPAPPDHVTSTGSSSPPLPPEVHAAMKLARAHERAARELEKKFAKVEKSSETRNEEEAAAARMQARMLAESKRSIEQAIRSSHGGAIEVPVFRKGKQVGTARAQVSTSEVLRRILEATRRSDDEIPFAVDPQQKLFTVNDNDRRLVTSLGPAVLQPGQHVLDQWIVVTSRDSSTGTLFGIAKPVGRSLAELRSASARNFGYGLALIGLALIGIVPLSSHFTKDIGAVTAGAQQIAHGDLATRVPVRSQNEVGQLAVAFNQMAEDLQLQRLQLVKEERLRKEQELEQRLLKAEYDRKTLELEEARRFQLSLLPKELPRTNRLKIAVYMQTATEVGGDYYDFHSASSDTLTTVIGDATGHGARAGTMVTVIKSLFATYDPKTPPAMFLATANDAIRRMDLGRMSMALLIARLSGNSLTVSNAAMPPVLHFSAMSGSVAELAAEGMPLGTLATSYDERSVQVESGDTLLLMSDGFPELIGGDGEPLGYSRALTEFAAVAASEPEVIVERLTAAAREWNGGSAPNDDITFVVLKIV